MVWINGTEVVLFLKERMLTNQSDFSCLHVNLFFWNCKNKQFNNLSYIIIF